MIHFAPKKPALLCTFNDSDGVAATAYSWADPRDIRPSVSGVPQQFVVNGASDWAIASNRLKNVNSVNTFVGIQLESRARRMVLNIENDVSSGGSVGCGIILRAAPDMSTFMTAIVNRTIGGTYQLGLLYGTGFAAVGTGPQVVTVNVPQGTMQPLEVIDDGSTVVFNWSGSQIVVPTTLYNTQKGVGVCMRAPSTELLHAENLIAWT